MSLKEEILNQSSQIRTDSYAMSVGELVNLYRDDELDLHPAFQRFFRWSDSQKTRLIESILLGIPVPPVFVAQREDGVWDVIDGQQRLSTIFQLLGVLRDADGNVVEPLVLHGTKFLPSLQGCRWDGENALDRDQKLWLKRAKIDVNIVLKESDSESKYALFMRLNTGGTPLTDQEVRNCLMIMAYPGLFEWINTLSNESYFIETIAISERQWIEQYPLELATRFLLFRRLDENALKHVGDIGEFLSENLERLHSLGEIDRKNETDAFVATFRTIFEQVGENAFRKFDLDSGQFKGGFSISAFEATAYGIGFHANGLNRPPVCEDVRNAVEQLWGMEEFTKNSGSGVRAATRIPRIVPMARLHFRK